MSVTAESADLRSLAHVDPDAILDDLNDSIARRMPSYRDLYLRWERLNWSVHELDFTQDCSDWAELTATQRHRLLWTLAAFYVAEQRVAATITPYVQAAPKLDQKIFLATQAVDEARHAVFFDRWFEEVVAAGDEDLAKRLRSSRRWLGPGFEPLFDEYLEDIAQSLRDDPGDVRRFAKALAVYHIVVEGVLALTGQKFILAWARNTGVLPGFRAGFTAVARDESRHVSFGARAIRDLLDEDPSLIEPIHEGLRETLLLGTRLYQPPGGDVTFTRAFGYSLTDLFNYGGVQLEKKMRAIGAPMPWVDINLPEMDAEWPPPGGGLVPMDVRQRVATSAIRGLGRAAPSLAPGIAMMALYAAFVPKVAEGIDAVYKFKLNGRGGGVYTVTVRDGRCRVRTGEPDGEPDAIFEMDGSTWVAMSEGRVTGDEAVLLGKARIQGDVVLARKFNDLFAPPGEPRGLVETRGDGDGQASNGLVARLLRRKPAA